MIRKFLAREGRIVLEELGVPDTHTLLRRLTFWIRFYVLCGIILLGVYAVGFYFGIPAMFAVVFLITLAALRQESTGSIMAHWAEHDWLSPPTSKQLPPAGPRQITQTQRRAPPGPKK
jgi:hypothetical protein